MESNVKSIKSEKIKRVRISDNEEFEVRDIRDKFYIIDDVYMNGYARVCGIYATGVYNVLCRYVAQGDQSCYPSVALMSDKLGISVSQVHRAIKVLEKYSIIKVKRIPGVRSKYWLTDKSVWKDKKGVMYYKIGNMRRATRKEKSGVRVV